MDWEADWDAEVGLWWANGPGHTPATKDLERLHPGCNAAARLTVAAHLGKIDAIDVPRLLNALSSMQMGQGDEREGCVCWYREEDRPHDTNASFFTGLSLIVLQRLYAGAVPEGARPALDGILAGLRVWFGKAVAGRSFYYPNKYLGDLVCGWLLHEMLGGGRDEDVLDPMRAAAAYWAGNGWGWGEHMSDGYSRVCLDEISLLLLVAEKLPDDVRRAYEGLLADLLTVEDSFDGGVRVPAIRSYAFSRSPEHTNYRDSVRPFGPGEPKGVGNHCPLGPILYELGWHDRVPHRAPRKTRVEVPCYGGVFAHARIEEDVRLGSLSRFPVMPSAEHPTWGLSWQSFPVTLWRPEGDWGFLQWETSGEGEVRAHPAQGRHPAHIPKQLTATVTPPVVGETHCLQHEGDVVALRMMPRVAASWSKVVDRLRVIDLHGEAIVAESTDGWARLDLVYAERTVSVAHVGLAEDVQMALRVSERNGVDWEATVEGDDLANRRAIVGLWGLSLEGPIAEAPEIVPIENPMHPASSEERAVRITWRWPGRTWRLIVDPRSGQPLRETGDPDARPGA